MSLKANASLLAESQKELSRQWQDAREHWRDAKADGFENTYLDPLPALVAKSLEAMGELDRFLEKVRGECE